MDIKKYHTLLQSSIFKNLSSLVAGTVLAQLIVIAFQIVLRRLFSPEEFGAFAVYSSIVGIGITIASLRYEQSIVLPKKDIEGWVLMWLSIGISIILILLFSVFLFLASDYFLTLVGLSPEFKHWLIFLPITLLIYSVYQAINYFLIRQKKFKLSGSNKVIRKVFEGVTQLLCGLRGSGIGLIIGDIIGNFVIILTSFFTLNKSFSLTERIEWQKIKDLAKRYKRFPLKSSIPSLMNALSRLLPILLISRIFDAEITGYFDLARVVLIVPLSLITVSLNQILVQQFSEKRNKALSIKNDAIGTFIILLGISALFVLIIKFFGTAIFMKVFGEQWSNSGLYAEILVWSFAIKFLIAPFNATFIAFEKIGAEAIWQIFYFILILGLFLIPFADIKDFLRVYVIIELVSFTVCGIVNFNILYNYEKRLKQDKLTIL